MGPHIRFQCRGPPVRPGHKSSSEVERLAGVPVYALSNNAEEFVLVSGAMTGKSLGLFCFKKEDAAALLEQMRSMNREMREGSRIVPFALNKVFQLKVDGVAFRLILYSCQIANAIKEMGDTVEDFPGVPVFQSRSLVLRSQNKRYLPVFFRKVWGVYRYFTHIMNISICIPTLAPKFLKEDLQDFLGLLISRIN